MKPEMLSKDALNRALLARQMLLAREAATPAEAIGRLAGLQAQQPQPPFVGLWARLAGFGREDLLRGLREREVVRATLMRGTLHLMTAGDFLALRGAIQPALSAGMRSILRGRAEALDIPSLVAEARRAFVERPRTFTELRTALMDLYPDADERAMGYAVRTHLPLVVVPGEGEPWGYRADADFADAEGWLGAAPDPSEQAESLALRYLAAFGPATVADFQAWSGLAGAKGTFEALRPRLATFRDERKRELFDLPEAPRPPEDAPAPARLLPGFDNLILSHADRARIIADEHRPRVVTKNLLVLPTFTADGYVAGTWKASRTKGAASLVLTPFAPLPKAAKSALAEEAEALVRFLEPDAAKHAISFEGG